MPRGKGRNKDYGRGLKGRRKGIFKKSFQYHQFYPCQMGIIIKYSDGSVWGYQSEPGFLDKASSLCIPDDHKWGPDNFETIADRHRASSIRSEKTDHCSPQNTSQGSPSDTAFTPSTGASSSSESLFPPTPEFFDADPFSLSEELTQNDAQNMPQLMNMNLPTQLYLNENDIEPFLPDFVSSSGGSLTASLAPRSPTFLARKRQLCCSTVGTETVW